MNFSIHYFTRYKALPPFFADRPDDNLQIIIVIPCYDDTCVFDTLQSLDHANPVESKIEVIVVVNSGERTPTEVVGRNRMIYNKLIQQTYEGAYAQFRLLPIWVEGTVKKKAGVGFARKVGMDEAVRRFAAINRPDGLIVSLDADALVAPNYLQVAEKAYQNKSAQCFTFQFQHHFDRERYSEEAIRACRMYEIYLRYFRLALKMLNVPFAIHTIGSCFTVRAEAYIKLGGMPVRQAGEDFYFLQKAVKMHPVCEINDRIVFPAPRISERVPFGTGATIRNIVSDGHFEVYNFELFNRLKLFYDLFPSLEHKDLQNNIPSEIMDFIGLDNWRENLAECRQYSASSAAFRKRMYDKYDGFFIIRFLNSFNESSAFPPMDIHKAASMLLEAIAPSISPNGEEYTSLSEESEEAHLYNQILSLDLNLHYSYFAIIK